MKIYHLPFFMVTCSLMLIASGCSSGGDAPTPNEDTVALNSNPIASSVTITDTNGGNAVVGDTLKGNYIYADEEGDNEGASIYSWLRNGATIGGETASTYTLVLTDSGQSISFKVTPVAVTGSTIGSAVSSAAIAVINFAPTASSATITDINGGDVEVGNILTGSYTYGDVEDDLEGVSTFRWLRNGVAINGATDSTYTLVPADMGPGLYITFEVTPVAITGTIIGDAMTSSDLITEMYMISYKSFFIFASNTEPTVIDPITGVFTKTNVTMTVFIGDRNNLLLTDSHTVYFKAEYGTIEPSCVTVNGSCEVTWSAIVRPDAGGPGDDMRATIIAYVIGEESFTDANGNGVFDDGDTIFVDLEEPYIDSDESGSFTSGDSIVDVVNGNDLTGANGAHDIGDTFFNGPGCTHSSLCSEIVIINGTIWDSSTLKIDGPSPSPNDDISAEEAAGLVFLREEEKLARDTYIEMFNIWNINVFDTISRSEQTHTDAVLELLEKYNITDPVGDNALGVFTNQALQSLYDTLVAQGSASLVDALLVGAAIEEIELIDTQYQVDALVGNGDIAIVYESLMKDSRNHLRSFVSNLEKQGIVYDPQYLSQQAYDEIVNSPMET